MARAVFVWLASLLTVATASRSFACNEYSQCAKGAAAALDQCIQAHETQLRITTSECEKQTLPITATYYRVLKISLELQAACVNKNAYDGFNRDDYSEYEEYPEEEEYTEYPEYEEEEEYPEYEEAEEYPEYEEGEYTEYEYPESEESDYSEYETVPSWKDPCYEATDCLDMVDFRTLADECDYFKQCLNCAMTTWSPIKPAEVEKFPAFGEMFKQLKRDEVNADTSPACIEEYYGEDKKKRRRKRACKKRTSKRLRKS